MVRIVLLILVVSCQFIMADDVEIPDDLYPIEGSSEILYSYEFDDFPKFIERISDDEFLVVIFDNEDVITYVYNTKTNTTEKKTEFIINDDERLIEYKVKGNKLILRFTNAESGSFFGLGGVDGFYWRESIVDLKTFMPESSRIFYTTIAEEDFEFEDYNEDLDYANKTLDKSIFIKGLEEKEIDPEDFRYYSTTYNENDSSRKNFFYLVIDDNDYTMYGLNSNFYKQGDSPDTKFVVLQDSVEDYENITYQYSYLDDQSNLYFIMSWMNDDIEKRYISVNKITPDGKLTQKIKEVSLEIDDDYYVYHRFEKISLINNKLKLFGISRYEDEESQELESISSMCILEIDLATMDFDFKERHLTEDEGEEINNDDDYFKFNVINKVIEKDDGYVVLAENNKQHVIVVTTQYGTSYTYLYYFNDINLFALDKDLNVKWNNFIDRDAYLDGWIFGNPTNSYFGSNIPAQVNLVPVITDNEISFIYSTTEPEDEIRRIKYNLTTGEKVDEVSLFENDAVPSYYPGIQYPIGNNEFVTLVNRDDFYLVRYKLLK